MGNNQLGNHSGFSRICRQQQGEEKGQGLLFLMGIFLFAQLGCAPKNSPETAVVPRLSPEVRDQVIDQLIERSIEAYDLGLEFSRGESLDMAITHFDQALVLLLECGDLLNHDPALMDYYSELLVRIHEAEISHAPAGSTASSPFPDAALASPFPDAALEKLLDDIPNDLNLETEEGGGDTPITYDVPIVHNPVVMRFVERFTTLKANVIGEGLERSTRYLPQMRKIFREKGLPLDLCYLPLIESAYKIRARSKARALGLWQFMAATGRLYGLKIDWWEDQRLDPERSTRAAAEHLEDLYEKFGSWELALCAYNAGSGRVARAIRRGRTRDFWELYRRRLLPRETRGYIPAFMAGVTIARNPDAYGFANLSYHQSLDSDALEVDFSIDLTVLAESMDVDPFTLLEHNTALLHKVTPNNRTSLIKVPAGLGDLALKALRKIPTDQRLRTLPHVLKRGDTLSRIAGRYGTTVTALKSTNNIRNPRRLRVGSTILIPIGISAERRRSFKPSRLPLKIIDYQVKRGDTLYHLSKRFQTEFPSIQALNPEVDPLALQPGQRLQIQQGDRWKTAATKAVRGRSFTLYKVARGDTVAKIARKYGADTAHLLRFNGLEASSIIYPGQRLKIPNTYNPSKEVFVYKVKNGDTLSAIAKRFNTRVGKLMEWNHLRSRHRLSVGQTLIIYRSMNP